MEKEWGSRGGLSSLWGCATVWSRAELWLWAKNTSGKRGKGREKERKTQTGGMKKPEEWRWWKDGSYSGGCSAAQCTALCSALPSSLHHLEHEHFFNHSRESQVEPSRGRVSHCSICSHHAFPPPLDIPMPHISTSPASTSLFFFPSAHLLPTVPGFSQ